MDAEVEAGVGGGERCPAGRAPLSGGRARAPALVALLLIVLLGAFLRFYMLGAYSVGNAYYAATVKSMLTSWHNFFFASFEPGGSVTVDKPPLGFWIQAASAAVLGLNGFALALPQALAGVLSILVLYALVRRSFGDWPGLAAALVLAAMPVAVSTERNNTIDGLLILVLLLAAWAFLRAAERASLGFLLLGALLLGLGFNIKMLQAYMPLPAFYLVYLLGARQRWWKRLAYLALATAALLVVSLSWAVAVDLTPADNRPYVGSSTDNSVLELIVGHNGLARLGLVGRPRQPGPSVPPPAGGGRPGPLPPNLPQPPEAPPPGQLPQNAPQPPYSPGPGGAVPQQLPGGRVPGGTSEVGRAGLLRLFTEPLVTEAGWLLPLALLGIPLVLVALGRPWPLQGRHLALVLWAGWLLPAALYFTFNTGLFHVYYLIMLGPPLAALVGATAWALGQLWLRRPGLAWGLVAALAGLTVVFHVVTLGAYPVYAWTIGTGAGLFALAGLALLAWWRRRWAVSAAVVLLSIGLLLAPLVWSVLTALNAHPDVALPRAGPGEANAGRSWSDALPPAQQRLVEYLVAHTAPDGYLCATLRATEAAPLILATGRPVLAVGGFSGNDNVAGVEELSAMVQSGELRFFLGGDWRQKAEIAAWLQSSCRVVAVPGLPGGPAGPGGMAPGPVLYDCRR